MKNLKKKILVVLALTSVIMLSTTVYALPGGWSFSCSGTTGWYSGPGGSWMSVPGHRACKLP